MTNKPNFIQKTTRRTSAIHNSTFIIQNSLLWFIMAKNGAVLDNFGSFWDKFGVGMDNFGIVLDKVWNTKTPQNRLFNTINKEKQTIHTIYSRYNVPIGKHDYLGNIDGVVSWY